MTKGQQVTGSSKRALLTTSGTLDPEIVDKFVCLGVYDCLLPCRFFRVDHKVTVLGAVSVFGEFVLRLLKAVNGLKEEDLAAFFGFNFRELNYTLSELMNLGYVDWSSGSVSLSVEGEQLFNASSSVPMIYDVELRSEYVGLDLVSRAIEKKKPIAHQALRFPELPILNKQAAANGASTIRQLFRESYSEIAKAPKSRFEERPSLYSIDAVVPGDRFFNTVRVQVGSVPRSSSVAEVSLADWGDEYHIADRSEVLQSARTFSEALIVSKEQSDLEAYEILTSAAPEFLQEWTTTSGLSVKRFYRECLTRTGEVRSDRKTVPVLGSLFVRENARRLIDQLKYVEVGETAPQSLLWLCPEVPYWGATTSLMELVKQLQQHFSSLEDGPKSIGAVPETGSWYVSQFFDETVGRGSTNAPRSLEIMLVPGYICSIIVYAPLDAAKGIPVPLGIISRDHGVVERTAETLRRIAPHFAAAYNVPISSSPS